MILFGKLKSGGTVRVLLDREKDALAFEFITEPRPPKKKPKLVAKASVPKAGAKKKRKPKEQV